MINRPLLALLLLIPLSGCQLPGEHRGVNARFGMVTDVHYADIDSRGSRHYRQSMMKLQECVAHMISEDVDFLIELGDFKDFADGETEETTLAHLDAVENELRQFGGPLYHVLGNHDVDNITKQQFLDRVENTDIPRDRSFYAFNRSGVRFIVLDANFRGDGAPYSKGDFDWTDTHIPPRELEWLKEELRITHRPVVVFIHQPLDGEGPEYVKNAPEVRNVLESAKRVLAVFQGHRHDGGISRIEGINYYTLPAMVEGSGPENSAYAVVRIESDLTLSITGRRKAESVTIKPTRVLGSPP